jgi:hypothetical protein
VATQGQHDTRVRFAVYLLPYGIMTHTDIFSPMSIAIARRGLKGVLAHGLDH